MTARLDIHHHAITARYRDRTRMQTASSGMPELPDWTPEASLSWMDAGGIGRALLSPAARGFGYGDVDHVVSFASDAYDDLLGLRERHPDRFGVLAPLPLPSLRHAMASAERALRHDGVDGIALLSQYGGRYVGEPGWDDLLGLLNDLDALVHLHPTAPVGAPLAGLLGPHLVDYVFDTTRVIVVLAKRGAFTRYPRIRWVFAHGGGVLPYVMGRLEHPAGTVDGGDRIDDLLAACRFDSALLGRAALAALMAFAGRRRVVYGSDLPFIHDDRSISYQELDIYQEADKLNAAALPSVGGRR